MATGKQTLTYTRIINVPPSFVYRAFTNATALREWLCDRACVDVRVGGYLHVGWNVGYYVNCAYTVLEPDQKVAFTWYGNDEIAPTEVEVLLKVKGTSTEITLNHTGVGTGPDWGATIKQFNKGWEIGLDNLQSVLETGVDQRLAQRPILALNGADSLDAEYAASRGIPVTQGLVIGGLVKGVGAAAAGLQDGDAIVSMDGKPILDFGTYAAIMAAHKAGDQVAVEYYRGPEKRAAKVTLASQPQPEVPATPAELAEQMKAIHTELDAELDALFKGLSEAEASYQSASGEWSCKQVLAHLIWTERHMQMWMWGLAGGDDQVVWPDNNPVHLNGILAAYPKTTDLIAAMKSAEVETRGILAGLTPDMLVRRGSYRRLATGILTLQEHNRGHFKQIQNAIQAARQ